MKGQNSSKTTSLIREISSGLTVFNFVTDYEGLEVMREQNKEDDK